VLGKDADDPALIITVIVKDRRRDVLFLQFAAGKPSFVGELKQRYA
jgi:hypothetical protein